MGRVLLGFILFSLPVFGFESVSHFWEKFRESTCQKARDAAAHRVQEQAARGSEIYDGPITQYKGRRIIRFIHAQTPCEALWSEFEGRLFDYGLEVEVEALVVP
ncbi:MAG: hypothetical protein HYR96_05560 [Deltaproteobacteria bacterium]|nr:hypothetical protein [Deltaproteobacteria bacterium]